MRIDASNGANCTRLFISPEEFADIVGVSPFYVRKLCRQGIIKASKFPNNPRWYIHVNEILNLLKVDVNA